MSIVKRRKTKRRNKPCANDIDFEEFITYAITANFEPHWRPIHKVCNPCLFHPQYVGKVGAVSPVCNACLFQLRFLESASVFTHPQSVQPLCLSSAVTGKGGCCFIRVQTLASFSCSIWDNAGVFTHPQNAQPLYLASAEYRKVGCCFIRVQTLASFSCNFWEMWVFLPIHKVCDPCVFRPQCLGKVGAALPMYKRLPLSAAVFGKCRCFYLSTKCATLVSFIRSILERWVFSCGLGEIRAFLPANLVCNPCLF